MVGVALPAPRRRPCQSIVQERQHRRRRDAAGNPPGRRGLRAHPVFLVVSDDSASISSSFLVCASQAPPSRPQPLFGQAPRSVQLQRMDGLVQFIL